MFNDFCGNESAKNLIEMGVKAALKKKDRLPNYLFSGMAGVGKTTMANKVIDEANALNVYVNASSISSPAEMVNILKQSFVKFNENEEYERIVLIIDECHALSSKIEDFLLTALSENKITIKSKTGIENFPIERVKSGKNDFLSWIFISNRCGEMANALRSRLIEVQFVKYTHEEKEKITEFYLKKMNISHTPECLPSIANRAWTARNIVNYVGEIYDYLVANDIETLTPEGIDGYFNLIGVDEKGLNKLDRAYISAIIESGNKASLQTIASKLNIGTKDVQELIEPRLLDLNMIEIVSGGRVVRDQAAIDAAANPFSARR